MYAITDQLGGRKYVGSSVDMKKRCRQHFSELRAGTHHCQRLQRTYRVLGESNLRFDVLEAVPDHTQLAAREQHWIQELKPWFNSTDLVGRAIGKRQRPESLLPDSVKQRIRSAREAERQPLWELQVRMDKLCAAAYTYVLDYNFEGKDGSEKIRLPHLYVNNLLVCLCKQIFDDEEALRAFFNQRWVARFEAMCYARPGQSSHDVSSDKTA